MKRAGAGPAARPGGSWHVNTRAGVLWNFSTGFGNYKEPLEKVNLHIYTFAVVCIYNGVIIQTLSERSLSAEVPGILSTELMIFYLWLNAVRLDCMYSLQKFI